MYTKEHITEAIRNIRSGKYYGEQLEHLVWSTMNNLMPGVFSEGNDGMPGLIIALNVGDDGYPVVPPNFYDYTSCWMKVNNLQVKLKDGRILNGVTAADFISGNFSGDRIKFYTIEQLKNNKEDISIDEVCRVVEFKRNRVQNYIDSVMIERREKQRRLNAVKQMEDRRARLQEMLAYQRQNLLEALNVGIINIDNHPTKILNANLDNLEVKLQFDNGEVTIVNYASILNGYVHHPFVVQQKYEEEARKKKLREIERQREHEEFEAYKKRVAEEKAKMTNEYKKKQNEERKLKEYKMKLEGRVSANKAGIQMKLTEFRSIDDCTIMFPDGTKISGVRHIDFMEGEVKYNGNTKELKDKQKKYDTTNKITRFNEREDQDIYNKRQRVRRDMKVGFSEKERISEYDREYAYASEYESIPKSILRQAGIY